MYSRLTIDSLCISASKSIEKIQIASAFVKLEPFARLAEASCRNSNKLLVSRWQFCDLVSGVSDLEVYEIAKRLGWKFYFHQDLHAKVYLFDEEFFAGSANLTNRGMAGGPPSGNIEFSIKSSASVDISGWLELLTASSIEVDDELYSAIRADVESYMAFAENRIPIRKGFSQTVSNIIYRRKPEPTLFLHDLPRTSSPYKIIESQPKNDDVKHDLQVLGLSTKASLDQVRTAFQISPGFTWLLSAIGKELYFGAITSKLHDSLRDEPKPYRSEVKKCLVNLLNWSVVLFPEQIVIDRPNHSQRIRRLL